MRRRLVVLAALGIVAMIGAVMAFTSSPRLLSTYDWAVGGGEGASRIAAGVPFGSQGQTLDIWAPKQSSQTRRPVIVFWYGGGWAKGDRAAYAFAGRALAREGFLVVIPDYRKVPAIRFPAFLEDGAQAVRWVRDNIVRYGGNSDRIAFMGHSAGAYEAVMLALDQRWLEKAGVDPAIVKAAVGLSGPYDFYPFDAQRSIDAMSYWPEPAETQPITYARGDAPPMLLITSDGDETVRARNTNNLAAKLETLGADVRVENYGRLSHEEVVMALSKPFHEKGPVLADSTVFLREALNTSQGDAKRPQ